MPPCLVATAPPADRRPAGRPLGPARPLAARLAGALVASLLAASPPGALAAAALGALVLGAAARADDPATETPEARLLKRASMFAGRSQYPQAIELCDEALRLDPASRRAAELRGFARMKIHDYEGAVLDFERGDPGAAYHDVNLGYCLRKVGRLADARARFAAALPRLAEGDPWRAYARDQAAQLAALEGARAVLVLLDARDHLLAQGADGKPLARAQRGQEQGVALDALLDATKGPVELRVLGFAIGGEPGWRVRIFDGGQPVFEDRLEPAADAADSERGAASAGTPGALGAPPPGTAGAAAAAGPRLTGVALDRRLSLERGADGRLVVRPAASAVDLAAARAAAARAEALWAGGDEAKAIDALEDAARRFPTLDGLAERLGERCGERAASLPVATETAAERSALLARASAAWRAVLEARRKLAALAPDDAEAQLRAASAAVKAGQLPEAEHHYRAALKVRPDHPLARVGHAQALIRLDRPKEALEAVEHALAEHPRWPYAHVVRGDALLGAGDVQGALRAYERAVEIDPAEGEWVFGKVAAAVHRGGANAAAIAATEAAVAESPDDPEAQRRFADALLRGLRFEEAHAVYQQALSIAPDLPGIAPQAGLAAELSGDAKQAVRLYRLAGPPPVDGPGAGQLERMAARRAERLLGLARGLKDEPPARAPRARPLAEARPGPARERALAALEAIRKAEPRLAAGLAQLPPLADGEIADGEATALERVAALVLASAADAECALGLRLIARQVTKPRDAPIAVDGALADWMRADRLADDPRGDAGPAGPSADLAELYAVAMADRIYAAARLAGPSDLARHQVWFELRGEPLYGAIAVGVTAGEVQLIQAIPGKEERRREGRATSVEARAGEAIEVSVPGRWLNGARRVRVVAYTFDPATGQRIDTIGEREVTARVDDGYAPAVLALFRLAEGMPLEPPRVAAAIALASGEAYAIGGAEVEARAAAQDRRFLALARRLDETAAARGVRPLGALPFEVVLVWATRSVQHRPATPAGYVRYTVSVEALEAMAAYVGQHDLIKATPGETVLAIERHLQSPLRWQYTSAAAVERGARLARGEGEALSERERRDLEKFVRPCVVDGMKLHTDGAFTQDLAFDYLLATDALVGHCGNMAQLTVDLCRAVGIPATIAQGREESSTALFQNPHAFPIYWDGGAAAWRSVQGQRYAGNRALALYVFLPPSGGAPPADAFPTGVGTHWRRQETTYEDVGALFRRGDPGKALRAWLEAAAGDD